jgi:TPR repeat protein
MRIAGALGALVFACIPPMVGCGACDSASRTPGPSDAASCPHGVILTRADYDQLVYQLDWMCPAEPNPAWKGKMFVGYTCTAAGSGFESGRCGVPHDLERALLYYRRGCAAEAYPPACSAAKRLGG